MLLVRTEKRVRTVYVLRNYVRSKWPDSWNRLHLLYETVQWKRISVNGVPISVWRNYSDWLTCYPLAYELEEKTELRTYWVLKDYCYDVYYWWWRSCWCVSSDWSGLGGLIGFNPNVVDFPVSSGHKLLLV